MDRSGDSRQGTKLRALDRLIALVIAALGVALSTVAADGSPFEDAFRMVPGGDGPAWNDSLDAPKGDRLKLRAKAWIVIDVNSREILHQRKAHEVRSIASLTKLMTALVYMEGPPDLSQTITITREDARNSARSRLRVGEEITAYDLLHSALMVSDNRATRALVRASGMTRKEFVARMNTRARQMGMVNTHLVETTGLKSDNVSTAYECAILLDHALANETLSDILAKKEYAYKSKGYYARAHKFGNSDQLLYGSHNVVGGKTGYIRRAGWCLMAQAEGKNGQQVIAVVLGTRSKHRRTAETSKALHWGYKHAAPATVKVESAGM